MKKIISLFGILMTLILIAYMESSFETQSYNYPNIPVVVDSPLDEPVDAEVNKDKTENITPSLELRLEDQEEVDGYMVETYREYEVYRNQSEEVIKSIPTDNYEYLKYKM